MKQVANMVLRNIIWLSADYGFMSHKIIFNLHNHCIENLDPTLKIILQIPINEHEFGYF
jgi:hypothetical protein